MKRIFCYLSVVFIIVLSLSAVSFARDVSYENALAQELKELGLFRGVSETDFDLDREPSRVEALVMLIRILGVEEDVTGGVWRHPFSDVPSWADKYVGYAYSKGLTNGQSATEFGSGNASAAMYITFVLRALGYSDANGVDFTWNNPFDLAKSVGIVSEKVNLESFLRSDVVLVSHSAMSSYIKGADKTLSQKLIDAGVFSASKYKYVYGRTNAAKAEVFDAEQIYANCSSSVIFIVGVGNQGAAIGSGFFINDNGVAITNYHVIDGWEEAAIQTTDNSIYKITGVYAYSKEKDWAVIQVDVSGNSYLKIGDETTVVGGAPIYAIGSPIGLQNTISEGIISNASRYDVVNDVSYIQITAPISPGSSGGALINKYGHVIGITSATLTVGQNLNLAIPVHIVDMSLKDKPKTLAEISKAESRQNNKAPETTSSVIAPRKQHPEEAFMALVHYLKGIYNSYLDNDSIECYYEKRGEKEDSIELYAYYDKVQDVVRINLVFYEEEISLKYSMSVGAAADKTRVAEISVYELDKQNDYVKIASGTSNVNVENFTLTSRYRFEGFDKKTEKAIKNFCEDFAPTFHAGCLDLINTMLTDYAAEKGLKEVYSVYDFGYINYKK